MLCYEPSSLVYEDSHFSKQKTTDLEDLVSRFTKHVFGDLFNWCLKKFLYIYSIKKLNPDKKDPKPPSTLP